MTLKQSRYDSIAHLWSTVTIRPITRIEAERSARGICRHFGAVKLGGPLMTRPVRFRGTARRCWISTRPNAGVHKGWQRLAHDLSHTIFARRHPNFRPHAGGHAVLEREIVEYVIGRGWLEGTPKPPRLAKATPQEGRTQRIARTEAAIARWESKHRRAETALKKLRRRHRALLRQQANDLPRAGAAAVITNSSALSIDRGRPIALQRSQPRISRECW